MTIFQLLVYSCVAANGLDGSLLSMTCRWDARQLFASEAGCSAFGASEMGKPIFPIPTMPIFIVDLGGYRLWPWLHPTLA